MIVFEDDKARYRFFGVLVWFGLLMLFVPSWYANPVNFVPQKVQLDAQQGTDEKPILFPQAYRLPSKDNVTEDINQAKKEAEKIAIEDLVLKNQSDAGSSKGLIEDLSGEKNLTEVKNLSKFEKTAEENVSEKTDEAQGASIETKSLPPVAEAGDWLLLLISYPDKKQAQDFMNSVEKAGYKTAMKFYSKQQVYSVRVIDIESRAKAQILKQKLDKMFNLNDSIIRKNR